MKLLALLVTLLALAVSSGCGGDEQAAGASGGSEPSASTTEEGSATAGTRAEQRTEEGGSGETATLAIKGSPGTRFSGSCTVGDGEPRGISGQGARSFTYTLEGKPLKCEITSEDNIQVDLTAANTRSTQRISGGTLNLTYENGSVSSSTSSSSVSSQSSLQRNGEGVSGPANETGNVTSETRDVSGFDEVELRGVGNLSIRQTGSESLTLEAEEDVLPKIETEVVNGRLVIGPQPNTSIQTTEPINYVLTVKDLHDLKLSGSGDINAQDIGTDKLRINISGSGAVDISGRADSQEISVSGSGEYRAEDLQSKEANVDVGGSGSAIVNVSDALDARVSGSGSVEYLGSPEISRDVSGAGRVSQY